MAEEEFKILDGWESVRKRPGWYAGDISDSQPLVKEILDNALDEAQKGYASEIYLELNPEKGHVIADNSSQGFPLTEAVLPTGEKTGKTVMEASVSYLSAGSKFDKTKVQTGANGTGSTVVNFLSKEYLMVSNIACRKKFKPRFPKRIQKLWERSKERNFYFVRFKDGKFHSDGFVNDLKKFGLSDLEKYSTIIRFLPDTSIIGSAESPVPENLKYVMKILQIKGRQVKIIVNGKQFTEQLADYKYPFYIDIKGKGINPKIELMGSFELSGDIFKSHIEGSANGAITPRGRHIDMFRREFQNAIQEVFGKAAEGFESNGINLFIVLLANEVDFSSQAKTTLSRIPEFDPEKSGSRLKTELVRIIKKDRKLFEEYYAKLVNFKAKKQDLNKQQKINTILGTNIQDNSLTAQRRAASFLPSKLMDAYSTNRKECELFLVEGLSAASDFKKYRNPKIHAVLPLRGVPLNACNHDIAKVLERSQELRDMIKGIGSGVDGNYNLKKLRYGKIILATDSDPDGCHIAALLCGMFGAHCKYLLENGSVYMAVTPYYIQDGKYFYPGDAAKLKHGRPFKRIKGLGSLGQDFAGALINPKTRKLVRITPEGIEDALLVLTDDKKRKEMLVSTGAVSDCLLK